KGPTKPREKSTLENTYVDFFSSFLTSPLLTRPPHPPRPASTNHASLPFFFLPALPYLSRSLSYSPPPPLPCWKELRPARFRSRQAKSREEELRRGQVGAAGAAAILPSPDPAWWLLDPARSRGAPAPATSPSAMSGGEEEMKPSRGSDGQERQAMSGGLELPARHLWRSSMRPLEPGGGSEPSPGARAAAAPLPHPESSPDLAAAPPKHRHGFAGARRPRGCVDPSLAGTDNPAPATSRDAQAARDTSSPTPSTSRSAPLAIRHHHPHRGTRGFLMFVCLPCV
ncbi:unnamed protein product, partial [Urochloa humidicola]